MKFISYFKKNLNLKPLFGELLFFHEDDFCQIELTPKENIDYINIQFGQIQENSQQRPGEIGYANLYVRPMNKIKLEVRKILPIQLGKLLSDTGFQKSSYVLTGISPTYHNIAKNTEGFGKDYSAIYYDFAEGFVQNIWLTQPWAINKESLINFLEEAGKRWGLILVDWEACSIIDLSDKTGISNYLS